MLLSQKQKGTNQHQKGKRKEIFLGVDLVEMGLSFFTSLLKYEHLGGWKRLL